MRKILSLTYPQRKKSGSSNRAMQLVLQKNPSRMSELLMSTKPNESGRMCSYQWNMLTITLCCLLYYFEMFLYFFYSIWALQTWSIYFKWTSCICTLCWYVLLLSDSVTYEGGCIVQNRESVQMMSTAQFSSIILISYSFIDCKSFCGKESVIGWERTWTDSRPALQCILSSFYFT